MGRHRRKNVPNGNTDLNNAGKKSKNKSVKITNAAKLPRNQRDYSANWKQLLKTMESAEMQNKSIKKFTDDHPQRKVLKSKESKKPDIWFDDVDESLLDVENIPEQKSKGMNTSENTKALVKVKSFQGLTKCIGMDCEMVGVGFKGEESILARVSLVNHFGHCIYDKYVKTAEKVTDYRTKVSGIRSKDLENGCNFKVVQKEVSDMLQGRILVGHSIKNDLNVLFLTHPRKLIRDTALYKPFRAAFNGKTPSLKNLSQRMLGISVQEGEHSSVQDAQAAMRLYTMFKKEWEREILQLRSKRAVMNVSTSRNQTPNLARPIHATKPVSSSARGERPNYIDSD